MDWVLDASIALAWALPDETSLQADQFLSRISGKSTLWVPSLGQSLGVRLAYCYQGILGLAKLQLGGHWSTSYGL